VHHCTIKINYKPYATIFQFIILTFIYSSTHYTSQNDFAVKYKIVSFNGNRCPDSENNDTFFISRLVVAQFCYFSSRRIITMTAIFCMVNVTGYNKKSKKELNIRISYQLYGPFLMDLTYEYLVHMITWVTNLKAVPCNRPLKKCISSHINMTDQ
jgi:hypothetical protein